MALIDSLTQRIVDVARQGCSRIIVCALLRVSCEGWLKVELLKNFVELLGESEENEVLAEAGNVDLTVKAAGQTIRIELKTFPTNYLGSSGKPITNFISGVLCDLSKLTARGSPDSLGMVVWLVYPIPDPPPTQWASHLAKCEAACAKTLRSEKLALWENASAHLYIMLAR